jgi:hypothetical protein
MCLPVCDFLSALYNNENEKVCLRALPGKNYTDEDKWAFNARADKFDTTIAKLRSSGSLQTKLKNLNEHHGIFCVVNAGGHHDEDITRYTSVFIDIDNCADFAEQHAKLDAFCLPTSIRVEARKSVHAYWLIDGDCSEQQWREITSRLIQHFDSDATCSNPSRILRIPNFNHIQKNLAPKRVICTQLEPTRRYSVEQLLNALPPVPVIAPAVVVDKKFLSTRTTSARDVDTFEGRHKAIKDYILKVNRKDKRGAYMMPCPIHKSHGKTAFYFLPWSGALGCHHCGTGSIFLDEVCYALKLPFFNSKTKEFFYYKNAA